MKFFNTKYRMYIDECGNTDYGNLDGMERYLTLCGVIIPTEYKLTLDFKLNQLKERIFNFDIDCEHWSLHKKDAVNKINYYNVLNDDNIKKLYNKLLLELLKDIPMTIIAVVIDKKSLKEKYGNLVKHPYHYALENLMKRYILFLFGNKSVGDVLIENRSKQNNLELKEYFRNICDNGTIGRNGKIDIDSTKFHKCLTSIEIKIETKEDNVAGLQIADCISSVMRNHILVANNINTSIHDGFWKEIDKVINPKIRVSDNGIQKGFGTILIQ